jgi:hypothetical protein
VDNWNNITNSQNRVRKKKIGGTLCFSNCHIIRLDKGGLVFLVSDHRNGPMIAKPDYKIIILLTWELILTASTLFFLDRYLCSAKGR